MNVNDIRVKIEYYRNLMYTARNNGDETAYKVYRDEVRKLQAQLLEQPAC